MVHCAPSGLVLVTGGNGFVGSALVAALQAHAVRRALRQLVPACGRRGARRHHRQRWRRVLSSIKVNSGFAPKQSFTEPDAWAAENLKSPFMMRTSTSRTADGAYRAYQL
jgi:nucleoside-diphosphate-sugar epimerase